VFGYCEGKINMCKHKKILLFGGNPDYPTDTTLKRIVCGQCGCSMTRKIDPSFSSEYIYVEVSNNDLS
jgi:hypothetical protein